MGIQDAIKDDLVLLASESASQATRTSAVQTALRAPGVAIHVRLQNTALAPRYTPVIDWLAPDGSVVNLFTAATTLRANGNFAYLIRPGASGGAWKEVAGFALPRRWQFSLQATFANATNHADTYVDASYVF